MKCGSVLGLIIPSEEVRKLPRPKKGLKKRRNVSLKPAQLFQHTAELTQMQPLAQSCLKGYVALIALRPVLGQPDTPKDTNEQNKTPNNNLKNVKMEGQVFFSVYKLEPAFRERSVSQNEGARGMQGVQQVWFAHRTLGEKIACAEAGRRLEGLPHWLLPPLTHPQPQPKAFDTKM